MEGLPQSRLRITINSALQLGFDEWSSFLQDPHLTAALLDRITVNCAVFNMKDCISIRPKNIVYATKKQVATKTSQGGSSPER